MTNATGEATIHASSHLRRTVNMDDFDSVAVTKTCNGLYARLLDSIWLLTPSASTPYYVMAYNDDDFSKTIVNSYKFLFLKLCEFRKQVDEALRKPWIGEIINRSVSYRGKLPDRHSTFMQEAQERLIAFEGMYRRLWENLECPETVRPRNERVNEDRRIWREFEQDRNFDALTIGLQDELAAIKRAISEQRPELTELAESKKPFDWSIVVQGANEQQERLTQELEAFHENQQTRIVWQSLHDAVMDWRGTWDNATLSRGGQFIGEFVPIEELTRSLNGLSAAIESVSYSKNLLKVEPLFNPALYDDADARKEAFALKAVLKMLVAIRNGHDAKQLVTELWGIEPLPNCRCGFEVKDILRLANHWPLTCGLCSKQIEPSRFGKHTCRTCSEAKKSDDQINNSEHSTSKDIKPKCVTCHADLVGKDADRSECYECRSSNGKMGELYVALFTIHPPMSPEKMEEIERQTELRIPHWPKIRTWMRDEFGYVHSDKKLWEFTVDRIRNRKGCDLETVFRMKLDVVVAMIERGEFASPAKVQTVANTSTGKSVASAENSVPVAAIADMPIDLKIVSCYTGLNIDDRITRIEAVLNSDKGLEEKLAQVDRIMPIPRSSTRKVGKMFSVSHTAIQKTEWYTNNWKDQNESKQEARRSKLLSAGRSVNTNSAKDD